MDYKETLHMPKTDFEMRGNLPSKEPTYLEEWEADNHYEKILERNRGNKPFVLHDGPPYANGHLHVGHAINKILKDFVVKYHYFKGKQVFYTPGWDCHGLPIEQQVANTFESQNIVPFEKPFLH